MRNVFDDFMEELNRRQADKTVGGRKPSGRSDDEAGSGSATEGSLEDATMRSGGPDDADDTQDQDDNRPESPFGGSIFRGGSRRSFGGGAGGFGGSGMPELQIGRGWKILGGIALVLFLLLSVFGLSVGMATDAIWFQSIGFGNVFWTRLDSQVLFFGLGMGIAFAVLWINLWIAGKTIPKGQLRQFSLDDFLDKFNIERYLGGDLIEKRPITVSRPKGPRSGATVDMPDISRPVFWVLLAAGLILALGLGGLAVSGWDTIQLYLHRVPFGQNDLTFGKDISFFLFELPFYRLIQSYANTLLLMTLVAVGIRYIIAVASGASMPTSARIHIGALAALYLWSAAIGYQLDRYELVNSTTSGIFQGASYTDVNARMLAMNVMTALTAFVGCFILAFTVTRWKAPVVLTLLFWAASFLILEVGYPQVIQRISVEPNQQAQESPYIDANIKMTRLAFNLTKWSATTKATPQPTVTPANVAAEPATIQNVRLWDYRPLKDTLAGVQEIRQYYTFPDVDTDRYYFTDAASCSPNPAPCVRQVMLSGRELDESQLAQLTKGDQSWVNQHITYTHGYGLVMVPVNEVQSGSGQPTLFIKDFPPVSTKGVPDVTRPQIYFGTKSSGYVIVDATSPEFDYPPSSCKGCDQYVSWSGTSGIKLDTPLSKLLFAAKFGDLNMLISSQITGSSQLLYNRSIRDRVSEVAPFLRLDKDPYMVLRADGTLAYVQDAFTTSASFPGANSYNPGSDASANGLAGDSFNYIRNSVKVVMDAYSGDMTFYVTDQNDPIIKAWEGVFPGLFKQLSEMPVDLRGDAASGNPGHLRYPEDLLNAQTAQFTKYHVTDPSVFYQNNDVWDLPPSADSGGNGAPTQLGLEAYYVQMRIPGEANPEFVLLQPMVPQGRQNMISWVAAHNDPGAYGDVSVFDYPSNSNVFGPQQIEALISQNGDISKQISLWNTNGSKVIMGNLLVIPLQDSILYIEPVYLQASSNPLPILQKVIIGTPSQVVWGDTLQDALDQIYAGKGSTGTGGTTTPAPAASGSPGITASPSTTATSPPTATPTAAGSPSALPSVSLTGNAQQLVAEANAHFLAAQEAARNGDWATYGKETAIVQQILAQLEKVVGTPAPSGP
jgi:uncharacterized membrane protein (UPF0182 family)